MPCRGNCNLAQVYWASRHILRHFSLVRERHDLSKVSGSNSPFRPNCEWELYWASRSANNVVKFDGCGVEGAKISLEHKDRQKFLQ